MEFEMKVLQQMLKKNLCRQTLNLKPYNASDSELEILLWKSTLEKNLHGRDYVLIQYTPSKRQNLKLVFIFTMHNSDRILFIKSQVLK